MKFEQRSMAEGIPTWNAFGPLPHSNNVLLDGEVARLTDPRNVVQEAESNSQSLTAQSSLTIWRRR